MRVYWLTCLALALCVGCAAPPENPDEAVASAGQFLSNIRQLTFGGQNAEAYWSPDGSKLVFQSTS